MLIKMSSPCIEPVSFMSLFSMVSACVYVCVLLLQTISFTQNSCEPWWIFRCGPLTVWIRSSVPREGLIDNGPCHRVIYLVCFLSES